MPRLLISRLAAVAILWSVTAATALAQTAPPLFETTKITDRVYVFRYQGHQAMFIVTPDGVIATDPISNNRPEAAKAYIEEIEKITHAPIKYVVYSHHHFDHIAGGKPFKDLGATFIAHRNAKAHLEKLRNPAVVIPDEVVDQRRVLELGDVRVELRYVGRNHSDNMLVMLVPQDKLAFAVDFAPIESVLFRDMPDGFLPDYFDALDRFLALDWDRYILGHPAAVGRLGTKQDVRNLKQYLTDLSDAVKQAASQGQCFANAMANIKLPKYESWAGYATGLPANIERFCEFWTLGIQ